MSASQVAAFISEHADVSWLPVALGLTAHQFYKRVEPTAEAFLVHTAILSVGLFFLISKPHITHGVSLADLWATGQALLLYFSTLSVSIVIYRLYINPLRKFPGHTLDAATKWGGFLRASRGTVHHVMMKKHRQLGDFVRIGPNEISIADASFIPIVHGNKSRFPKGPWYQHMNPEPVQSLIAILDFDTHKSRRKVWDEVFTPRALRVYETRIMSVFETLSERLKTMAQTGEVIDLSTWSERLLVDTTGKIAFNVDFNSVQDAKGHFYVEFIHSYLKNIATLGEISWLKPLLAYLPLNRQQMENINRYVQFSEEKLAERLKQGSAEIDVLGFLMTAGKRNPAYAMSTEGLGSEARLVIAAGSDTTSIAITSAMYWLLQDRRAYLKLREECKTIFSEGEEFEASRLGDWKRAPYLNGCAMEALRLLPSGPNGHQRIVNSPGGLMTPIGLHIPEGTKVSVPTWTVHHDPRNFEKPWDFIPERWIEGSGFEGAHNPTAFMAFSLGSYSCIGKPLALMQIRMFLYNMIPMFDFTPAPGFDKRAFIEDTTAWFGLKKLPLPVKVSFASAEKN